MATRIADSDSLPAPVAVAAEVVEPPVTANPPVPIAAGSTPVHARPDEERTITRNESVRATVENMRRHAREDPAAADALSEERIKAIEEKGLLVN